MGTPHYLLSSAGGASDLISSTGSSVTVKPGAASPGAFFSEVALEPDSSSVVARAGWVVGWVVAALAVTTGWVVAGVAWLTPSPSVVVSAGSCSGASWSRGISSDGSISANGSVSA